MNSLSNPNQEEIELRERVNRSLLYIGIFSSVMLFAGLTSAYIVRQADGNWLQFTLPSMFWVSTGLILASSASVNWALIAAKKDQYKQITYALGLTILLGIGFCITQILGWSELTQGGIYFAGKTSNPFGPYFFSTNLLCCNFEKIFPKQIQLKKSRRCASLRYFLAFSGRTLGLSFHIFTVYAIKKIGFLRNS
jgi:hypothetical protein